MQNPILSDLRPNNGGQRNVMRDFMDFSKRFDPNTAQKIITEKLNRGEISNDQFERAKSQAVAFSRMFGIK